MMVVGAHDEDSGATGINGNQADNSAADSGAAYVFVSTNGSIDPSFTTFSVRSVRLQADRRVRVRFHVHGSRFRGRAVVVATLLVFVRGVFVHGQARPTVPVLPLTQIAYIKASNAEAYDYFADGGGNQGHNGNSITISGDGNTMAVGAPYESGGSTGANGNQNDNSAYASGAVYLFVRQGNSWLQQAYIKASNIGQSDHFGASVALSRDGNTLAVAAPWESSAATGINANQNDNSLQQAGAVYVFTRTGSSWTQQAYIKASNTGRAGEGDLPGDGDQFGYSVALSGDGGTVAVGAISEDSAAQQVNGDQRDDSQQSSGAVYVFTRNGTAHGRSRRISRALICRPGICSGLPSRSASTATRS